MLVQNKKTYDYIVDNFPESLIAKSIDDLEHRENKDKVGSDNKYEESSESNRKSAVESAGVKLKRRMSSLLKGQHSILKKKEKRDKRKDAHDSDKPLVEEMSELIPDVPRRNKVMTEDKIQGLHNLKIRRQSMTYRGACLSTPRYHMKSSSCPDIYKNTIVDDTIDEECCAAELSRSMKKCCSLKYITLPFLVFCFSNFLLYFW